MIFFFGDHLNLDRKTDIFFKQKNAGDQLIFGQNSMYQVIFRGKVWCTPKSFWAPMPLDVLVKEILLEIGFVEELRITWGNKELPQTFFHNTVYLQIYDLIHLTPYHWQPCILQYCGITNTGFSKISGKHYCKLLITIAALKQHQSGQPVPFLSTLFTKTSYSTTSY